MNTLVFSKYRNARSKFTLPEMPYNYKALEPIISGEIMEIHHTKHHQAYITNYNSAEEKLKAAVEKGDARYYSAVQKIHEDYKYFCLPVQSLLYKVL